MGLDINQLGWKAKFINWFDIRLSWRLKRFMTWYCRNYYLMHCTQIGENFAILPPVRKPVIGGEGRIIIGNNVTVLGQVELMSHNHILEESEIIIGDGTMIGDNSMISACKSVKIGNDCLLARYVYIYDNNGHPLNPLNRRHGQMSYDEIKEVVIGNNVWIGHFAHVQSGVKIGDNSVIAANSVVTKDVPANVIVMGAPARVCGWLDRMFPNNAETTCEKAVAVQNNYLK